MFKETLNEWQRYSTTNLLRNHRHIQKKLVDLLGNAPRVCLRTSSFVAFCLIVTFQGLVDIDRGSFLWKVLILDLTALLGLLDAQITDKAGYEELVETEGPGAQVLVDLFHSVSNEFILFWMILTWMNNHSA